MYTFHHSFASTNLSSFYSCEWSFVHILGCVGVGQSQNVHFVAESRGAATVVCRDFPSETYDNIEVCNSVNVSFTNISFENCGPLSPNIFFNRSSGIVFDGCIFM